MSAPGPGSGLMNPRILKRVGLSFVAFLFSAAFIVALMRMTPETNVRLPDMRKVVSLPSGFAGSASGLEPQCMSDSDAESPLVKIADKYAHLRDDKFTIVMQTYQRPKELNSTLTALLSEEIPSLLEVWIVWNNLDEPTPPDYESEFGVKVHYRMSSANSLNQKLIPHSEYQTQALLLTDDDVYYHPKDLEFVFQSWRKFGRFRLVGALPRCSELKNDKWEYTFCSNKPGENVYSMILTNLCFSHIAFLDYYSSDDFADSVAIRNYVDEHFNCEDIALNYMASKLTGFGPLEVNGEERYVNFDPSQGISRKKGHLEARSQCLNDFIDIFGCMPLVDETAHIAHGLVVL
ncbi:hypothetical protein N3K66_006072 [Trichothecium roseum]|uniref:Uncharacterized protein n=1 Tax=Trichothecium roseum TaxID=47278 RepID=A0ACC0UZZ9_9HYPO|nr:hypothetical protein N3K66_006072 [Trichothecium roseum]